MRWLVIVSINMSDIFYILFFRLVLLLKPAFRCLIEVNFPKTELSNSKENWMRKFEKRLSKKHGALWRITSARHAAYGPFVIYWQVFYRQQIKVYRVYVAAGVAASIAFIRCVVNSLKQSQDNAFADSQNASLLHYNETIVLVVHEKRTKNQRWDLHSQYSVFLLKKFDMSLHMRTAASFMKWL